MSIFWSVKEIVEAKLEHFSALLNDVVEYEKNASIPNSLSHVIDVLVECKSLFVSIRLVVLRRKAVKNSFWLIHNFDIPFCLLIEGTLCPRCQRGRNVKEER